MIKLITIGIILQFVLFDVVYYQDKEKIIIYEYSKVLELGSSSDELDYIFVFPNFIVTDSSENIYKSDYRLRVIRKYNKEGEFLKNIGRKGRGPGEYSEIITLLLDQVAQELVVFDRTNVKDY